MADGPDKPTALPSAKLLNSLVKQGNKADENAASARGGFGTSISKAVEDKNLHAKAFRAIRSLVKLGGKDPAKLYAYLEHFDDYRTKLKLDDIAGDTLEDAAGDDEGEEGDEPELDEHGRPKPMFDEGGGKPAVN